MNNKDSNTIYVIDGSFVTDDDYSIDLNKFDEEYRKYISFDNCLEAYEINLVTDDFYLARDFLEQLIVSFHVTYTHHYVLLDLVERVTKIYDCLMNQKETQEIVYYCGNYDGTQLSINKIDKTNLTQDDIYKILGADEILTKEEKEYLRSVIKPFRKQILFITKRPCTMETNKGRSYIYIQLPCDHMWFPYFDSDAMYKGMEQDKKYTLEELGL